MADIHINKDDIKQIVESYGKENKTFALKSFIDDEKQKKCTCFINGKECKLIFYIKANSVNIMPIGKNPDECMQLIRFIESKGFSTSVSTRQFIFPCTKEVVDLLIQHIKEEFFGIITCSHTGDIYKFAGYNGDVLTFTYYQTNKAMIQGKPFYTYSVIITFLSSLSEYSFDQIVQMNNSFAEINTPSNIIRTEMQNKLGKSYSYLDEALLKSISGSLTLLKQRSVSEDYTGCVTGEFKAVEGYLKKLLSQKYNYRLEKKSTFSMFFKEKENPSKIDLDKQIPNKAKNELNKLYSIYANKRNVYLHSSVDPAQTRIIETLKEAQDLSNEILIAIRDSYLIVFE